jgi:fructose-bisphosphate aldolase class 1
MKNQTRLSFLFLCLIFLLGSCAKIYNSPDARAKAATHKKIAIVPPKVNIAARKGIDAATNKVQETEESLSYQKEIYAWMLKRKRQGRVTIDIQELDITNIKLQKMDYANNPISSSELCAALGVDAVMTSNISARKTMSEGATLGIALLTGGFAANKSVDIDLSINDSEKLLFNYNHKMSGGIASSPSKIVDALMRHSSRKMPYYKL